MTTSRIFRAVAEVIQYALVGILFLAGDVMGGYLESTKHCYGCGKECDEGDYCFGCSWCICEDCDVKNPIGKHGPDDHLEDEEQ